MIASAAFRHVSRRAPRGICLRQQTPRQPPKQFLSTNVSAEAAASEGPIPPPDSQTQLANLALAAGLAGFCGFVFTYSMNAVGKADVGDSTQEGGGDPLAQLKAEAQEAKDLRLAQKAQRLSREEVEALESGMSSSASARGGNLEVAVAAPADIAQLEEEANLKVFRQQSQGDEGAPKKKPWWRFGF